MDFLGAMFEGIGKTFEAGANVNLGQIGERNLKRQLAFGSEQLAADAQNAKLGYLLNLSQQQTRTITIVIVALIVFVTVLLLFRKK